MKSRFFAIAALPLMFLSVAPLHAQTTPASPAPAPPAPPAPAPGKAGAAAPDISKVLSPPASTSSIVTSQSLALSDALEAARRGSFSMGSAQARIAAAQARLRAAGALPGTTLALAHAFGSSNTGGFDEDILLSQIIEIGKRGARVQAAQFERAAAQFDAAGAGTDLEFAVRAAYYDALRVDVERTLAADALQTAQTFRNAAQLQFTAGDVPRANVVRSSIELSRAQAALTQAESERKVRYEVLRSLLALANDAPLQLGDTLQFTAVTYDLAALQTLAEQTRPNLQSARATQQAKQAAVQTARAGQRPDAFVEARRAAIVPYRNAPNGTSLRVGVVVPIFDFGRHRAGISEAKAAATEQQAILDQTTRAARLDVATTYERFVAATSAVQAFDAGRLAQSRELLNMAQTGYERGANSFLELIDAQTVFRNEQADYARALAAWNTARADLERAVGGKLP